MSMISKMLIMRNSGNDGERMRGGNYGGYNRDRSGYNEYNVDTINYTGGDIESRFRDRTGREHYDNGRFAPMRRNAYAGNNDMRMPPRYPRYERGTDGIENRIGYDMRGEDEEPEMYWPPYWRGGDMHHGGERERGEMHRGHGKGQMRFMPMDRRRAEKWAKSMHNADGTKGAHWTLEQTHQVMQQHGLQYDPSEFYVILNAMYSDYYPVAKKYNTNTVDYYVDLAKAWLDDADAVPNKVAAYYDCVVRHKGGEDDDDD